MTLTLVIPVYKEHLRFESSLRQIVAFMAEEKAQGLRSTWFCGRRIARGERGGHQRFDFRP